MISPDKCGVEASGDGNKDKQNGGHDAKVHGEGMDALAAADHESAQSVH
jgi:hypothetical protein